MPVRGRSGCSGQNEGVSYDEPWSDREKSDPPVSGDGASQSFDRDFWDQRWSEVVREHPEQVAQRPANAYLTETVDSIAAGRALDAGCGHGSEALWLAAQGWHVTAVDFSKTALAHARSRAEILGPRIAERIAWVEGDLAIWTPEPGRYDLVSSLYVHVAGSVEEMVSRLATGVAPGGMLLLVGHLPVDPVTGAETSAAGQVQVTVDAAATLDSRRWQMLVADERPRTTAGTGFDAVICARRLT
jgi:SAM-dependent methyltransferase